MKNWKSGLAAVALVTVVALAANHVEARKRVRPLAAGPVDPVSAEDALQARLDAGGGVVSLPPGRVVLTRTLRVVCPGTTLRGEGPTRTTLVWEGPRDQPAVECRRDSWWFSLEDFSLEYPAGRTEANFQMPGYTAGHHTAGDGGRFDARDESTGLAFGVSDWANGTCTGNGRVVRVGVSGFDTAVRIGNQRNGGVAASEIVFDSLHLTYARHAVRVDSWNALNFRFRQLALFRCWDGIAVARGGSVSVDAGGSTHVGHYAGPDDYGAVLHIESGGAFSLKNFRAEGSPSGCLVRNRVAEASTTLVVEGCESSGDTFAAFPGGIPDADRYAVTVAGNASAGVRHNRFVDAGLVRLRTFKGLAGGFLDLRGNHYLERHPEVDVVGERPANAVYSGAGNRPVTTGGVPVK